MVREALTGTVLQRDSRLMVEITVTTRRGGDGVDHQVEA